MTERIDSLRNLVTTQRLRWQRLRWLQAFGWGISALLGYFLAAVLIDNLVHLPVLGRALVAAGLAGVLVWLGRGLLMHWRERKATEDEIALSIERRTPGGLQNRLINALQIARDASTGDAALSDALIQENHRHLQDRPLQGAVGWRPTAVWLAVAASLVVAVLAGWLWQPDRFGTSAARILLPFASIDPVYRTVLLVEPGDIEATGDVEIFVRIRGERPTELAVLLDDRERRTSHIVPVTGDTASYTVRNVERSLSYAVRGGDFTSQYYRIEVPTPARLARVRATYHYPEYVGQPAKTVESAGDLEAIAGTRAELVLILDYPADKATLLARHSTVENADAETTSRIPLTRMNEQEFSGTLAFDNINEYSLETERDGRPPHRGAWHNARVIADEPPHLELSGLPSSGEVPLDSPLELRVSASDDLALAETGLFARRIERGSTPLVAGKEDEQNPAADNAANEPEDGWQAIQIWPADHQTKVEQTAELLASAVGAAEGDRLELAARAKDYHPDRANRWAAGPTHVLIVAGEGAQLQILYEQILRSEAELASVVAAAEEMHRASDTWVRKLDADPTLDDNQPERVKEILSTAAARSAEQNQLRQTTGRIAREMVPQAGNLRLSLGMLADTEMIRGIRVLDSVATRDDAASRRTALAESRATQQRTVVSLQQIAEQYTRFRQDWELAHMMPYLRMLADRQAALRDESLRRADGSTNVPASAAETSQRRQDKLKELCGLAETAFAGIAERVQDAESELSEAFSLASSSLGSEELSAPQSAASEALAASQWSAAAEQQSQAAELLDQIYNRLHEAQAEAAARVLAALDELNESDLAMQAELEALKAGNTEDMLDEPDGLKLEDIIHMAEVARDKKAGAEEEVKPEMYLFPDSAVASLQGADTGKRQEFDILKLATSPGKTPSFPNQSDRQSNRVKPHIQEKFEDLVGDLLEEEDEMQANYETYNLNAAFNINEPGDIGKQGGDLNSTAAAAATGNQKPPTTNVGGASRVGRQGARAHGAAMGNESINRRGRDKVQEGQERSPDQAGSVKETLSDDPQKDTSTGVGGRKVESEDTHFSLNDAGEWTDDLAERMDKPQEKQSIVERQGGKLDAEVAGMLRDMNSKQEQIIERLKTIRKDLKNLYLPTDHLDHLIDQMQAHLHSLNDRPSAEVFRLQQETLEQLRGALSVFHQAHSGFQASLSREQAVRGRVLDDPARAAPPGYEEAVKTYYERLAAP
ncbi:MAG: hypothetical protein AB7I37_16430 [Pirellulales bacterium]